jgi:hypothetical protein
MLNPIKLSMDWFKVKSKPETIDLPIKYGAFRLKMFPKPSESPIFLLDHGLPPGLTPEAASATWRSLPDSPSQVVRAALGEPSYPEI